MADFPFIYPFTVTIAATSTGTAIFTSGAGEKLTIHQIMSSIATAGVNIINLRDSGGRAYMTPSSLGVIPLAAIAYPTIANEGGALNFIVDLEIDSSQSFYVDIQNTTGGQVVPTLIALCKKTTP